ncbi:unnamed protein product [Didymodactylos carnosus]|uniref:Aminotransferase class V domain-containing protein n=1 Tax=Didymodactylos carnosus TaxID=1234261 RepID=A0A814QP47_9BILA|nr:unnamed protein product [Didymodactylos carnosus]CAF1122416.1 unnamed protein product [Didymodactylos carnosus]CAF3694994.1 unnamed protein product [Didymodactylos carnosus]CAF3885941.1 unnamed protein product [Didymodactylos carnosus]
MNINELKQLLSSRTRLVALPHVSNLLGDILDVQQMATLVHENNPQTRLIIDGVAYAPHRLIDVKAWNVDFYGFSFYKVYGPHISVLYGTKEAWLELTKAKAGSNHFFIPQEDITYQYEVGCMNHEACAGILALKKYFNKVFDQENTNEEMTRDKIERVFDVFSKLEQSLTECLVKYLLTKPSVTLLGSKSYDSLIRVPTISFISTKMLSADIARVLHTNKIACRNGHMYAYRLVQALGLDMNDGVLRLSGLHYNTREEIDKVIQILDSLL